MISCSEAPVDDTLSGKAMPQHQQHFAKNVQIAETLGDLFPARGQYPLIYYDANRALFRIVAPMKDWHDFLGFLIDFLSWAPPIP